MKEEEDKLSLASFLPPLFLRLASQLAFHGGGVRLLSISHPPFSASYQPPLFLLCTAYTLLSYQERQRLKERDFFHKYSPDIFFPVVFYVLSSISTVPLAPLRNSFKSPSFPTFSFPQKMELPPLPPPVFAVKDSARLSLPFLS